MRQQKLRKKNFDLPHVTNSRAQTPPAPGQERGSSTELADLHRACLAPRFGWAPAGPAPHRSHPGEEEEEEKEGWTWLPCPGQRGDGQVGGTAHVMGLWLHLQPVMLSSVMDMARGNHQPRGQSKGTAQPPLRSHPQALYETVYSLAEK